MRYRIASLFLLAAALLQSRTLVRAEEGFGELSLRTVTSTLDQTPQPSLFWAPQQPGEPRPLLVFLHSWSGNYRQDNSAWLKQAQQRKWYFLHPNFRGRNDHPEACGSALARQDILDAITNVLAEFPVDTRRIYLAGASGGGHMSMLMAAYHPERFSAVSAWVGISDLAAWHAFHVDEDGRPKGYAKMLEQCCGGAPGRSPEIDAEYRARSPLFRLDRVGTLPVDLAAGVNDGHTGSVPVSHTLRAFNQIAGGLRDRDAGPQPELVTEDEIRELREDRRLQAPRPGDEQFDETFGRRLFLRRTAGPSRVTIFDGGHEGLPAAACTWLAAQQRPTQSSR